MGRLINLIGVRFGELVVVSRAEDRKRNRYWNCVCDCGRPSVVAGVSLTRGRTKTCGHGVNAPKHGHAFTGKHTNEYKTWLAIKQRCFNKNHIAFCHYGGRGITMCQEWKDSFPAFFRDVGPKPSSNHSIDRIDNSKNYEPGNCKWATRSEQMNNTRAVKLVTIDGETKTVTEWCDILGLSKTMVRNRIHIGWTPEKALTTPKKKTGRKPKSTLSNHQSAADATLSARVSSEPRHCH